MAVLGTRRNRRTRNSTRNEHRRTLHLTPLLIRANEEEEAEAKARDPTLTIKGDLNHAASTNRTRTGFGYYLTISY